MVTQYTSTMNNPFENLYQHSRDLANKYAEKSGALQAAMTCLSLQIDIPGVEIKDAVAFSEYLNARVEKINKDFENA